MTRKILLVAGTLLLLVGMTLSFQKPIMSFLVGQMSKETIQKASKPTEKEDRHSSFDFAQVKNVTLRDVLDARTKKKNIHAIGAIHIPKVKLQLPIVYGISNANLTVGAGTMKKEQEMGEGNYALAAHNMNDGKTLFSPLTKAKMGMKVYLTDFQEIYEYRIEDMSYVQPTQVDVIQDIGQKRLITLVTCNADGTQRLIVRGEYVRQFPYKANNSYFLNT
ncbi:class A sortase [Rummeliibacillus stabekisii]|uniref:class A sortase n=1 Tax=Rummeliibacillus stabekisii TaxID=241244 RepID=UPI00371C3674